jgi:hypothetical protein
MAHELDPELRFYLNSPWFMPPRIPMSGLSLGPPAPPAPAVFEFDTAGSAEGWAGNYFRDDKDVAYQPPQPVSQFPSAQYNQPFPLSPGTKPPYGVLVVSIGQFTIWAKTFGFPSSSAFWYQDIFSPRLDSSKPWQNLKGIEAWFYDDTSPAKSHISAEVYASGNINGVYQKVLVSKTALTHTSWVKATGAFSLGQGMTLENVIIRLKGEWAKSSLRGKQRPVYEGNVWIDHVAALQ